MGIILGFIFLSEVRLGHCLRQYGIIVVLIKRHIGTSKPKNSAMKFQL